MAEAAFQHQSLPDEREIKIAANNKRKRPSAEVKSGRSAPGFSKDMDFGGNPADNINLDADFSALTQHNADNSANTNGGPRDASDTAAAALTAYNGLTVPQPTEMTFQSQPTVGDHNNQYSMADQGAFLHSIGKGAQDGSNNTSPTQSNPSAKPSVGSDEWHKVRRDNHKEVERRRRETINEGINELAKIVPGCEKNKGSILQRAVQFITQLKENEAQNIEKWTLEKLLTEQAIAELSASVDKFKAEANRAWQECEAYKRVCDQNGIVPEDIRAREGEGGAES